MAISDTEDEFEQVTVHLKSFKAWKSHIKE